jgi:hypothetical protein
MSNNNLEVRVTCKTGGEVVCGYSKQKDYKQHEISEIAMDALVHFALMNSVIRQIKPVMNDYECEIISKFTDRGNIKFRYKLTLNGHLLTPMNTNHFSLTQLPN